MTLRARLREDRGDLRALRLREAGAGEGAAHVGDDDLLEALELRLERLELTDELAVVDRADAAGELRALRVALRLLVRAGAQPVSLPLVRELDRFRQRSGNNS